ncbi:MAG: FAD-dependent thymidylate synthase [Theionarchaea archaeon]|nr:FAD-dependent thymidylate synthase [Theionarchaea archaeon]MBU7002020.1 FAD-dependent thymidylate synthase [Theionarchaea archaeon]MBU7021855.1 FAD-dependent thymidylate synthase [Theionarchaea archaeon]MBU7036032.1 FAD-dependent thymidylate synthase [Theionarchaea archaeon]MBU7040906.1 FAD-dependent thymidylate synthase [Theionarchaea archaeon]
MNVELVAHTPDPDRLCAQAALVSKWPRPWSEFKDLWNDGTDLTHLTDAIEKGHISVIEHASFTFSLEGISRACSHQLVRHRLASYTQQSQRYVTVESLSFVTPPNIKENQEAAEKFRQNIHEGFELYQNLLGMKIPEEDARFILPNAAMTNIMVTMNARELLHFFALRCCERTQWELREVAWKMLSLVKGKAPLIFSKGGPSCVQSGSCPEKDLSCGKMREMEEKAAAL